MYASALFMTPVAYPNWNDEPCDHQYGNEKSDIESSAGTTNLWKEFSFILRERLEWGSFVNPR